MQLNVFDGMLMRSKHEYINIPQPKKRKRSGAPTPDLFSFRPYTVVKYPLMPRYILYMTRCIQSFFCIFNLTRDGSSIKE